MVPAPFIFPGGRLALCGAPTAAPAGRKNVGHLNESPKVEIAISHALSFGFAQPQNMLRGRKDPDFDEKARELFASLGLDAKGGAPGANTGSAIGGLYNPLDAIWRDKATTGTIFVGNQQAAQNSALLKQNGITHIVNCTDSMPFFHQNTFKYFRFNVTFWPSNESDEKLAQFLQPMLDFVDNCLAGGGCVLIHCLAGAHRAGTTGCMLLMHKAGLSSMVAVATAKKLRPVIDPIGRFPDLLRRFDTIKQKKAAAEKRLDEALPPAGTS